MSGYLQREIKRLLQPSWTVRGNTIELLNLSSAEILTDFYRQQIVETGGVCAGLIYGTYEPEPFILSLYADNSNPHQKRFAEALREASGTTNAPVKIYYGAESFRHESFHEASSLGSGEDDAQRRHSAKGLRCLTNSRHWPSIKAGLLSSGGNKGFSIGKLVEEAGAYIAEGAHERLGITRQQGEEFMGLWFDSFAKKNGKSSLKKFTALS